MGFKFQLQSLQPVGPTIGHPEEPEVAFGLTPGYKEGIWT